MNPLENQALADWLADYGTLFWTWLILPVVAAVGLYFTVRSAAVQGRMLPEMIRTLRDPALVNEDGSPKSISAFKAFTVSAASRVGVGNVAGVATAVAVGGPGAVFWMWAMAFIGGASSFIESTLGQLYKERDRDAYRGGPAYYMQHGLGKKWLGTTFAVVLIICFPFAFSSLQANTIVASVSGAMGQKTPDTALAVGLGATLAVLTGAIVFGGLKRIANVTNAMVPAMALVYIVTGLVVVVIHLDQLPRVLGQIITEAFNFNAAVGGGIGTVILTGVKRGMFSNEAGLGSAPNAGATAAVTHPVKQGLVQTLGVYFDTFIVCSVTAFIILVSVDNPVGSEKGIALTQHALTDSLGAWSGALLAVVILLLAFSSIIGNYYYGESNVAFMTDSPVALAVYRSLAVVAVFLGSLAAVDVIWNFADAAMGVMALINLVAILLLGRVALRLLKDYEAKRRAGQDPVFLASEMPDLRGVHTWTADDVQSGSGTPAPRRAAR
ncbi:alanine/glycine:cation symporter family protein [Falsarthrobacter nasiphocae]|uniref:AGCS family alanine or glycine:cation symporter n=1 Tax=Falsarthrobacter nasiphocae TaxID=189863 RepID=A0AAE4C8H0_9MICC|nr:alanine/glycine:cation symporter family protein [Falsarthrobacter nasiphocae]MDR6892405.1 AGCS family alanine or glycine:cation symporter [Falsarthrobacter nasiphocae]